MTAYEIIIIVVKIIGLIAAWLVGLWIVSKVYDRRPPWRKR